MPFRLGPGPVFSVELVAASRRWQSYALRSGVVLVILAALWFVILNYRGDFIIGAASQKLSLADYARVGSIFVNTVLVTQLILVLLVAPASTAGAICVDKARGNLTLLMATDMSCAEIVLGKLFARLFPVLILLTTSLPVLFIIMLMGGVNFDQLTLGFVVLIATAVFCCSLALWFSMYVGKAHEALLLTYFVILIWLAADLVVGYLGPLGPLTPARIGALNPLVLILEPASPVYGVSLADYQIFVLVACGWAGVFVLFAVWRLRRVVLGQENRPRKAKRHRKRASYGRLLNRNPLLWYERHRRRPTGAGRVIGVAFVSICVASIVYAAVERLLFSVIDQTPALVCAVIITVGLLLVTINAVTSLADERTRGSLDILLLTPVRSRAVLWAKWRSAFRLVLRLTIVSLVIALLLWLLTPVSPRFTIWIPYNYNPFAFPFATLWTLALTICSVGALLTSIGLMLATWIKNVARAIAAAIIVFLLVMFFLPILGEVVFQSFFGGMGRTHLSPTVIVYEVVGHVGQMDYYSRHIEDIEAGAFVMACLYIVFSVFAFAVAWIAFDRKMGRISRDKPVAIKDRTIWMKPVFGRSMRDVVE